MHFKYGGLSLNAEAELGSISLISLTALRRMHARYHADLDLGPEPLLTGDPIAEQDQFSQELQLRSGEGLPIRWVAGLYYIGLSERYDPTTFTYGGGYSAFVAGRSFQSIEDEGKVASYAAYGQASLPLGKSTRLTAGLRYTFKYASGRLRADAAFFYYDYRDLQVSAFTAIGSVTANATSADIYGIDLQLGGRLGDATDLTLGAQWLHARFDRFDNATCTDYSQDAPVPYLPVKCDATGNRLPFAPKFKANLGATRRFGLGKSGTLLLAGNLAYNDGYYSEADNVVRQDAYATVDISAEWRPAGRGPSVKLWVLNLTGAHYSGTLVTFPTTGVLQRPADPRRFGASVAYGF